MGIAKVAILINDGKAQVKSQMTKVNVQDLGQLLAQIEVLKEGVLKVYKSHCIMNGGVDGK